MKYDKKILIFLCMILSACLPDKPAASPAVSYTTSSVQQPIETSSLPELTFTAETTETASVPSTAIPAEEIVLPQGMPVISVPEEWYSTEMDVDSLHAVVFTHQNPEDETSDITDDFAMGALVTTPLPDGSDPAALQAGLMENLASYNNDDLEGMLSAAQQLGLIDLVAAEETVLNEARLDTLGGVPALQMDGKIVFEDGDLKVQVWLCWTREIFMAYYQFAENENWQTYAASFDFARNSIQFP